MLKLDKINVSYGDVQVLHEVSLHLEAGKMIALIGANGAGKTTLIKTVMGLSHPWQGNISFCGKDITYAQTHKLVKSGITCVPEGRHIFPRLSVEDNLKVGAYSQSLHAFQLHQRRDEVYRIFPRLKERAKQYGGTLSGGEQQMLAIGRALMCEPKLLILDEPSLGMAPVFVDELFDTIRSIHEKKEISILLVEQNAYSALEYSDEGYVLELGHIVKSGSSVELRHDPEVVKAYLGG